MNTLKYFLNKHKISTHTVAAVFLGLLTAYKEVPAFHDYALSLYAHLPHVAQNSVTVILALYAWYRNGQKSSQ